MRGVWLQLALHLCRQRNRAIARSSCLRRIPTLLVQPVVPRYLALKRQSNLHFIVFLAFPRYPCERYKSSPPHIPPIASLVILLPPPYVVPSPYGFFQFAAGTLRRLVLVLGDDIVPQFHFRLVSCQLEGLDQSARTTYIFPFLQIL